MQRKSKHQQTLDAELSLIIDEMSRAMWNANKAHVATWKTALTCNMELVLCKFHEYCVRYYSEKA